MLVSLDKWNPTVTLEISLIRKATAAKGKFVWTNKMEKVQYCERDYVGTDTVDFL